MRVRSIQSLASLSHVQLKLLDQLGDRLTRDAKAAIGARLSPEESEVLDHVGAWPWAVTKDGLRAYWFEDGGVTVAPFDAGITPGMDVIATKGAGILDAYTVPDARSATLHWALALRETHEPE